MKLSRKDHCIALRAGRVSLRSLAREKAKEAYIEKPSTVTKICPQSIFPNRKLKEVQQVEQRKAQEAER